MPSRRRASWLVTLSFVTLALPACASTAGPAPATVPRATLTGEASSTISPSTSRTSTTTSVKPTASAGPTAATGGQSISALSPTELKYALIARFGAPFFCDPDVYPVARRLGPSEIEQRLSQIEQNTEEYQAILQHLGYGGSATLSADQEQQVYSEHKMLAAIALEAADGAYRFNLRISQTKANGFVITGTIDSSGVIQVASRQATVTTCPICLAGDTLISTPEGPVPVKELARGMGVWTIDLAGARQPAVVVQTAKRSVPAGTPLVQIVLDDGRELTASAFHPTMDGPVLGDLARGDWLDGARVKSVKGVPDAQGETYDLLPSGETGAYWANGILVKSTLAR
ncbi:MAG: Hint domain-containing protein [Chloroflexi bacterium]|nr:Hint domain-containing protein [Chloroflexota bacterium]